MNLVFNQTAHRALWLWLASEFQKGNFVFSPSWPGWKDNGGQYTAENYCFACEYDKNMLAHTKCINCPLKHGCHDISSRLAKAKEYKLPLLSAHLAGEMAYAPIKPGVICK